MKKIVIGSIISILIAEAAGFLSSIFAGDIDSVYNSLKLPPLAPASWVFPIVWIVLYALIGIAAYMVFISRGDKRKSALVLYFVQLFINFWWTIIFFGWQEFSFGALVAVILAIMALITTISFWRIRKVAGWLMLPYTLWLFFAAYLAIGVAYLN